MDSEKPQKDESVGVEAAGLLRDEAATARLGARLAGLAGPGEAILLRGGLGAGKTALARALVQALRPGEEVPSPTFTLVQTYGGPAFEIIHYDLYRVESPDELWELGWTEAGDGLALVEWPERLAGLPLPPDRLDVSLVAGPDPGGRLVRVTGFGRWRERVPALGLAESENGTTE